MEHVAGPVDDGLEQLVPRSGGRRQAGDLVQEAQLFELVAAPCGLDGDAPAPVARAGEDADPTVVTGITIQA